MMEGKMTENLIVRVALSGGLIGLLFTNPSRALQNVIDEHNKAGWRVHQILPHSTRNIFMMLLSLLVLVVTLGIWTFGAGYIILLERQK